MTSRALLALAETRVPRYTSYPTAAQFGPLDATHYRAWLAEGIRPADTLSLYVHVPFCRSLCWYCACHTRPTRSDARIGAYEAALHAEIDLLAAALPAHAGVSHLHLGGGTPSILGPERLRALIRRLRAAFGLREGAEIAIELDPRHADGALIDALAESGLTRASLGVQDIAPDIQAAIGRIQPQEQVADAVRRLRAAGIASVNLDLMYGLPHQTADHVAASAGFAAALGADRIAVFGYAHVAWMRPHQKAIDAAALPGVEARLDQAERAEAVLAAAGYQSLGLDHFARPGDTLAQAARDGRLRRNFQGYTTDTAPALLGLGASAIGSLPGGFAQNEAEERRYIATVREGRLPVVRGRAVTAEDRLRAGLIARLMCEFRLDLKAVRAEGPLPAAIVAAAWPRLSALADAGLIRLERDALAVTKMGRRLVRQVASCFDAYLPDAAIPRHSVAV